MGPAEYVSKRYKYEERDKINERSLIMACGYCKPDPWGVIWLTDRDHTSFSIKTSEEEKKACTQYTVLDRSII